MVVLKWVYLGFFICFYMGRVYEAERQDKLRERGTLYMITNRRIRKKRRTRNHEGYSRI